MIPLFCWIWEEIRACPRQGEKCPQHADREGRVVDPFGMDQTGAQCGRLAHGYGFSQGASGRKRGCPPFQDNGIGMPEEGPLFPANRTIAFRRGRIKKNYSKSVSEVRKKSDRQGRFSRNTFSFMVKKGRILPMLCEMSRTPRGREDSGSRRDGRDPPWGRQAEVGGRRGLSGERRVKGDAGGLKQTAWRGKDPAPIHSAWRGTSHQRV